jgi:hypothetical protein
LLLLHSGALYMMRVVQGLISTPCISDRCATADKKREKNEEKGEFNMRRRPDPGNHPVAAGVRRLQQQQQAAESQNIKIKKKWRTCNLHVTWSGSIYLSPSYSFIFLKPGLNKKRFLHG